MHGTIMVFFVLTAGLSGTFSNFLIPLQVGARDMASGFMNMLSYWFFFLSSVIMFTSLFTRNGTCRLGLDHLSAVECIAAGHHGFRIGMTLWLVAMALFIVSTLLGGINYITTVINLRTRGHVLHASAPYDLGIFLHRYHWLLSFPVLFAAALLLIFDRSFGTSFYLSDIYIGGEALAHDGGSPDSVPALVLVSGSPGSVYRVVTCTRNHLRNYCHQFTQADLRL